MFIGESINLKAIISPSDATVIEVIWASSKQSVASVDQSGIVVAIAEGTSTITATAGGKVGSCVVTVSKRVVDVSSIILDKTSASLKVGEKVSLTATVKPDDATDKTVTWSTSDASIATISDGVVTAIKLGSAIITAKAGDKEATCAITVEPTPVTTITLDKTGASLKVGEKITLTVTVKPDDATDKTVTWSTSDASVATVDNGVVTAIKLGSATITAKAGDKEATCAITVEATPVSSIILDKTNASLKVGEKVTLTATVKPEDATDKTVTWSTSDASVATVNNGVVTAIKLGSATITAKAGDKEATCAITVEATPVSSIILDKTNASLKVGEKVTLTATVKPDDATDKTYIWSSSDNSVAAVDQNGKITAKAKGKTVIKATANDGSGVFASCAVLVRVPYTAVAGDAVDLGLSVKWSSMNLGATTPTGYGDYFAWGETAPKEKYSWETYELCTNGTYSTFTRYNSNSDFGTVDNKTEFKDYNYEDDAARQALGGNWRMPTDAEWTELREQCTWTWTTQNGVYGSLVTSKTNGNSIFLPAAGRWRITDFEDAGSFGYYFSSTVETKRPQLAWLIDFNYIGVYRVDYYRCCGYSVRPVSE